MIDHLCGVRCCVNPDHLEPVTTQENIRRGEVSLVCKSRAASRTGVSAMTVQRIVDAHG